MKKSRGLLISLLAVMLVASLGALVACGQGGASQSSNEKETLSVNSEPEQALPPVELKTEPFYVLIIGNDSREGTVEINKEAYKDGKGRADTLMMARIDPKNYQISLITVPRDTKITYNGETGKINEMLKFEGVEGLKDAVTELTGVKFDYYLMCRFGTFEQLIDDLGGLAVDVKADQGMTDIVSGDYVEYPAGWYDNLNGKEALVYARERHNYDPNGEVYRQSNDRHVVKCIIEQVLAKPETAVEVATKLAGNIETDWDERELLAYVEDFMKNAKKVTFVDGTGPWYGDMDAESGLWVTTRDEETWAQVMDVVNKGGSPREVVETLTLYEDDETAAASESSSEGSAESSGESAAAE